MGLDLNKIRELNYQMKRIGLDIKNLERTIETKRRNRFLDEPTELGLRRQIGDKRYSIATLQSEIRRIENEAQRSRNMEEGLELGR